jgi:hypothetical protein
MGPDGALYAVEMATGNSDEPPHLTPGTGRIVRQTGSDGLEPVVTDLEYPTYLDFGPDGASTSPTQLRTDAGEGRGALLRIDLPVGAPDLAGGSR